MSTAVATTESDGIVGELMSANSLTARLQRITETMQQNMKPGVDYGKIPGTPKPSLYKPGAEKLCALFSIAPDYEAEDLSTADNVRIRVKCIGRQQGSNIILGSGIGECSSDEAKYKWRAPVCEQEYQETPVDRRRAKWMKGRGGQAYQQKQIRTEPADSANTVLKMAAKRAHVAMTLNVTGATAIFTQDLEDLPEENRAAPDEPQQTARRTPQAKAQAAPAALNESQLKVLRGKMSDAGMPDEQLCTRFKISKVEELPFSELNAALAFVADPQLEAVEPK